MNKFDYLHEVFWTSYVKNGVLCESHIFITACHWLHRKFSLAIWYNIQLRGYLKVFNEALYVYACCLGANYLRCFYRLLISIKNHETKAKWNLKTFNFSRELEQWIKENCSWKPKTSICVLIDAQKFKYLKYMRYH